jgi:hypothetical protein
VGWGWIGWADTWFLLVPGERHDLARAEAILKDGLAVPDVRDREDVLDRLATLYEDSGRAALAPEGGAKRALPVRQRAQVQEVLWPLTARRPAAPRFRPTGQ